MNVHSRFVKPLTARLVSVNNCRPRVNRSVVGMGDTGTYALRSASTTCMAAINGMVIIGHRLNGEQRSVEEDSHGVRFASTLATAAAAGGAGRVDHAGRQRTGRIGCAGAPIEIPDLSDYTIGFAQVGAESGWRTANTQSIQDAAEEAGVELLFTDAQGRQEAQVESIRGFIEQGVDLIAFSPIVETGWDAVLIEARDAGSRSS